VNDSASFHVALHGRNIVIAPHYTTLTSGSTSLRLGGVMALFESHLPELDPLDLEILERAFDAARAAVKEGHPTEFDSDEGLEAILRRELIEIAYFSGVTDPETLRDLVLATLSPVSAEP
jgi:hypothetical protein